MKILIWLILFSLGCLAISAGTIDPKIPDEEYISYGSKFHYVMKISGKYKDGTQYRASCVAVAPRWIITAAHVVENSDICFIQDDLSKIIVTDIIIPEGFLGGDKNFGYFDIALCHLESGLSLSFYPALYKNSDEVGKISCIAGYGMFGTFHTGGKGYDDNRRAGSNIIDKIDRNLLICSPSGPGKKTSLEFLISSGDSGGGLFIDGQLAGIHSCVISVNKKPNSSYGDESGHTRISTHHDWINRIMGLYEKK